jgi:hypothetical protein
MRHSRTTSWWRVQLVPAFVLKRHRMPRSRRRDGAGRAAGDRRPRGPRGPGRAVLGLLVSLYAFVRRKDIRPTRPRPRPGHVPHPPDRDAWPRSRRARPIPFVPDGRLCPPSADCRDATGPRGGAAAPCRSPSDRIVAEGRYSAEPVNDWTPERLFDRRWATGLLENAVARLEAESTAAGKSALVSHLLPTLTGGRATSRSPPSPPSWG